MPFPSFHFTVHYCACSRLKALEAVGYTRILCDYPRCNIPKVHRKNPLEINHQHDTRNPVKGGSKTGSGFRVENQNSQPERVGETAFWFWVGNPKPELPNPFGLGKRDLGFGLETRNPNCPTRSGWGKRISGQKMFLGLVCDFVICILRGLTRGGHFHCSRGGRVIDQNWNTVFRKFDS